MLDDEVDQEADARQAEARVALRAVLTLLARWDLTRDQKRVLLGGVDTETFGRWRTSDTGPLPDELVSRLDDLIAIHDALRDAFPEGPRAWRWIKEPEAAFDGDTALAVMLEDAASGIGRVWARARALTRAPA